MHAEDTEVCFHSHLGLYACEPLWLAQAVQAIKLGLWPLRVVHGMALATEEVQGATPERERLFTPVGDTVALVRLSGAITKGMSKFGGASTILTKRALRQAVMDPDIQSILLVIDSPGGQVAGVDDLAREVRKTSQSKPVAAYIEDLGASAAYWIASQAQRVTSNPTAQVGSIGVFCVLQDLSGMAEREGVSVRVVSTGPYKGLGAPGTPVTQELVDEVQRQVDQIGTFFFRAVQEGRRLTQGQLGAVTDGRVWLARQAHELGLLDGIESFDEAVQGASRLRRRQRSQMAQQAEAALTALLGV